MKVSEENMPYTLDMPGGRPTEQKAPPFGERMAIVRAAQGLSQSQLAEKLHTTREMINYYERRARNPTSDFIQKAAKALGVTADELLGIKPLPERQKPGPASKIEQRFEKIKSLPRNEQLYVIKFLDQVLTKNAV